jgi:NH3-dependent NAD+ synthetase
MTERQMNRALDRLKKWLNTRCSAARRLYIPMSGGTDSALGFVVLNQVFPSKTVGIHIGDKIHEPERNWFISVGDMRFVSRIEAGGIDQDTMRWALLNSMCRDDGAWLIGTRNKTEQVMGTYSLASRLATIQPLVGLWKAQVMALAKFVGVPEAVLESSSQADPNCGRPPEMAEIGLDRIDFYARCKYAKKSRCLRQQLSRAEIAYLNTIYHYNRFKAKLPLTPV